MNNVKTTTRKKISCILGGLVMASAICVGAVTSAVDVYAIAQQEQQVTIHEQEILARTIDQDYESDGWSVEIGDAVTPDSMY